MAGKKKNEIRIIRSKQSDAAASMTDTLKRFLWLGLTAAAAIYSTSVWGVEMREALGDLWSWIGSAISG